MTWTINYTQSNEVMGSLQEFFQPGVSLRKVMGSLAIKTFNNGSLKSHQFFSK